MEEKLTTTQAASAGSVDRRSDLARARGLGSAKEGVQHWWLQRLTALALVPLSLWFVASVVCLAGATRAELVDWLSSPFSAGLLLLCLLATFWHGLLGLQVVIEDYVHSEGAKLVWLLAIKALLWFLAVASLVSVVKLSFAL
ncbi:MAG TPA: succinate dehydrogenase, hydrophobic membrane anchor protein [Kiloniellales bacterium]|nr:succinate dehydrogenase, hydrophobic membrane anchor protein [Kiloniellales bacterium]